MIKVPFVIHLQVKEKSGMNSLGRFVFFNFTIVVVNGDSNPFFHLSVLQDSSLMVFDHQRPQDDIIGRHTCVEVSKPSLEEVVIFISL